MHWETKEFTGLSLLWYSVYGGGLEPYPLTPRLPVISEKPWSFFIQVFTHAVPSTCMSSLHFFFNCCLISIFDCTSRGVSSPSRDSTRAPCTGAHSANPWTPRKSSPPFLIWLLHPHPVHFSQIIWPPPGSLPCIQWLFYLVPLPLTVTPVIPLKSHCHG